MVRLQSPVREWPRSWRRLAAAALVLCAALFYGSYADAGPVGPQLSTTINVGRLRVTVDSWIPGSAARGFAPVRILVTNDGSGQEVLDARLSGGPTYDAASDRRKWSLRLAPGESRSLDLLASIERWNGHGFYSLQLNCGGDFQSVSLELADRTSYAGARVIAFLGDSELPEVALAGRRLDLTSDDLALRVLGAYQDATGAVRRHRSSSGPIAQLFSLSFDDLPSSTVAWSSVDTVVVDVARSLPSDPRWQRLLDWVREGGQVAFVGKDLERNLRRLNGLAAFTQERYRIDQPDAHAPLSPELGSKIRLYQVGFGTLALQSLGEADVDYFSLPASVTAGSEVSPFLRTILALDAVRLDATEWPSMLAALHASSRPHELSPWTLPFPDNGLPIRAALGLLTIFALLVGPFSVTYARKKKKPGLLLVAVPVISLVATAVIVGYGVLRQGLGTEGYAHSLSIVDQVENQVSAALRRELVMGRGGQTLQPLPSTMCLVPMLDSPGQARIIEQDGNQLDLSGDFLPVRTRTGHVILSSGTTRARLEWEAPTGDSMAVSNALGVELEALEVMSPDGRIFAAEGPIGQGASATLTAQSQPALRDLFEAAEHEPMFAAARLRPGGYLAVAAAAGPGVDDASVKMEELLHFHGIVGYLDLDSSKWTR